MYRDGFGHNITTDSAATAAAVDVYTLDWIGYGLRLRTIFAAAESDSECAFANACAASVHMALEARSGFDAAQAFLTRMRRGAYRATERDRLFIAATDAWAKGCVHTALSHLSTLVAKYPTDIAAAKWAQYHAFNLGDAQAMRHFAERILAAHATTAEAWGMLAFASEQCHDLDRAENAASRAMALGPGDPWTHHALAHIFARRGQLGEGIRFLRKQSEGWNSRSIFIREHNWWHLAVLHLEVDERERALAIFDEQLWGTWKEFAQEQIGAVQALWRLELSGMSVGERWIPVAEQVSLRGFEHILPFHDIHFAYALARVGFKRQAERFLRSLARKGEADRSRIWAGIVLPVASAVAAHAVGDFERAERLLAPVLRHAVRLGGSHAQRDVLIQTYIDAALRTGHSSAARDLAGQLGRGAIVQNVLVRADRLDARRHTQALAA